MAAVKWALQSIHSEGYLMLSVFFGWMPIEYQNILSHFCVFAVVIAQILLQYDRVSWGRRV